MTSKSELERELAEVREVLRQTKELYSQADRAGDGHTDWVVETDTFYGSPRFLELCGLPPGTVFGGRMGFVALFPFHPDDRDATVSTMTKYFASDALRLEADMRLLVKGETRWVHMSGICTRDSNGKLVRWNAAITDITGRKRMELALRQSEERFALAAAASADGIWDWDINNDRMFLSERAQALYGIQLGLSVRSRSEWRALQQLHPEDAPLYEASIDDCMANLAACDGAWRVKTPDGSFRWIRLRGLCVPGEDGKPARMGGSVSDIDHQKRSEAAAQQSQRLEAMGTLAGGIAHDFNNILGAVLGYGEMALRDAKEGTRLRRDLKSIVLAGERGRALVDRILSFSRSGVADRMPVRVQAVVQEALNLATASLPSHIGLEAQLNAVESAVMGDPTQIHQVVMNLVTNAAQSMPEGGKLLVRVEPQSLASSLLTTTGNLPAGDYLTINVADSGCGIPDDIMGKIFDPFFTTKDVGVGTGLGLSLVHGIVTQLGGTVNVTSEVEVGSVFTVYLPLAHEDSSPASVILPGADDVAPQGNGERILLVDDEKALLIWSSETLTEHGYLTAPYSRPADALEAFRTDPHGFSAVITDERMPGMTGTALIREMRKLRSDLPVALVSGYLRSSATDEIEDSAPVELMLKPLSAHSLALAVARLLEASKIRASD